MSKEDKPFFLRRLPEAVRRRLADEAGTSERTLTAEIIHRLRQSLRTSNQAADPAPLSTSETKSRPACDRRAARSAVFDSTYPAGRRDNHELNDAKDINADHGRQVP